MKLLEEALDLMLPHKCIVCGKMACDNMSQLNAVYKQVVSSKVDISVAKRNDYKSFSQIFLCQECATSLVPIEKENRWNALLSNPYEDDPYKNLALYLCFDYEGIISRIVPLIKFHGKPELAILLGIIVGELLRFDGITADLIIPMPLSDKRLQERCYNQAELIAHGAATINSVPLVNSILRRTRHTERQTEIKDLDKRMRNVNGAFEVDSDWDLENLRIILVDDVATTGYTMHEAAIKLLEAGAKSVLSVAVAGNRLLKNGEEF